MINTTSTGINNNLSIGNITSTSGYSYVSNSRYILFGVEFESNLKDPTMAMYISMLNILGIPFYNDIKKQGVVFTKEVEDIITPHRLAWERNSKIDSIL